MKRYFISPIVLFFLFLTSCSDDKFSGLELETKDNLYNVEETIAEEIIKADEDASYYRLSVSEARDAVFDFFKSEDPVLRSVELKEVKEVEVVYSVEKTEKPDPRNPGKTNDVLTKDTLSYIVNFANNSGFAIVSADKRTESVLFFSENGNYSFKAALAEDSNDPFLYQMELIADYIQTCKSEFDDSKIATRYFEPSIGSDMRLLFEVNPKVRVFWGQSDPYNAYCPMKNGQRTLVGCVAVAMGMVMSVTQHVSYFNNVYLDWNGINRMTNAYAMTHDNTGAAVQVQRLLRELGNAVGMNYGLLADGGSGANSERAIEVLTFGGALRKTETIYRVTDVLRGYSDGVVYVRGDRFDGRNWLGLPQHTGHAFVIDGYREYVKRNNASDGVVYYHVNLGWEDDPGYIFSKVYGGDVKYAGTNHKEAFVHNMKFWGLYK